MNKNGVRINPSKSVIIDDCVWVGNRVTIDKGVNIKKNSIIGAGAIVTKSVNEENVIIADSPAKVIKREVSWEISRI